MNMRWAVCLAALVLTAASEATADFPSFPICTDPADQGQPDISGQIVVWQDYRNGNWDIYGAAIDISDPANVRINEFPICTDPADQDQPAISGQIVVWRDDRNGGRDIYGINLTTGAELVICTNAAEQGQPDVSGDVVVWQDGRNEDWDIYGKDLSTGSELDICTDPTWQVEPAISGDLVLWTHQQNPTPMESDIYGCHLPSGNVFAVCTAPGIQDQPDVRVRTAAWHDVRDDMPQVSAADIDSSDPTWIRVTPLHAGKGWGGMCLPRVGQEVIVAFDDGDPDKPVICGYDPFTGSEFAICTGSASPAAPGISGDLVVWQDGRNDNQDIYAAIIPEPGALALVALGWLVLIRRRPN